MSETSTTTNSQAASVDDIIRSVRLASQAIGLTTRREPTKIKVGSMDAFTNWCDRQFPMIRTNDAAAPSLVGVPVVLQDFLPWFTVVVMVGDDVRAVYDLREPSPPHEVP